MKVRNYRDLIVWQKAMDLVELVYKSTSGFPREEVYGLTNLFVVDDETGICGHFVTL